MQRTRAIAGVAAVAAAALVGVRFRLHGRCAQHGVDCAGLIIAAYASAGHRPRDVPDRYRRRGVPGAALRSWFHGAGFDPVAAIADQPGDILLVDSGAAHWHLLISGGGGAFIHAHAGLGRVVAGHGAFPGAVDSRWRLMRPSADQAQGH